MSLVRVHNFSISLDGFGAGEPQGHDAPFGHAGERLHEWMFTTGYWVAEWLPQMVTLVTSELCTPALAAIWVFARL